MLSRIPLLSIRKSCLQCYNRIFFEHSIFYLCHNPYIRHLLWHNKLFDQHSRYCHQYNLDRLDRQHRSKLFEHHSIYQCRHYIENLLNHSRIESFYSMWIQLNNFCKSCQLTRSMQFVKYSMILRSLCKLFRGQGSKYRYYCSSWMHK